MTAIDPTVTEAEASRAPAETWQPSRRLALVCLVAIGVVAAALRFPTLATQSLWLDEAASYLQARGGFVEMPQATAADTYPPLHNALLWLAIKLFGDAEWSLRLPSALAGVANVFAIYWVGTLVGGRKTGLIAALLLALSAFHLFYSQEARMYALLALTATLFAGTIIAYLQRQSLGWAIAAVLAGAALLYAHPYGLLVWAAIIAGAGAGLLRQPNARGQFLRLGLIAASTAITFSPWAVIMAQRAAGLATGGFWIAAPTLPSFIAALDGLFSAQLAFVAAFAVVGGVVLARHRPAGWVLIAWAIVPFAAAIAYSLLVQPIFVARYAIAMLPALLLLAAVGIAMLGQTRMLMAAATLGVVLSGAYGLYAGNPPAREDWRGVVAFVDGKMDQPDDCLVVTKAFMRGPLQYYRPTTACLDFVNRPDQLRKTGYPGRVFVVASHIGRSDLDTILAPLQATHGEPTYRRFTGIDVYSFGTTR